MGKKQKFVRRRRNRLPGTFALVAGAVGLVVILVLASFYTFGGGGNTARSRSAVRQPTVVVSEKQTTVTTVDKDYEPRVLTVPAGSTVTWHNDGDLPHTITDDRSAFDSGVFAPGEDYARTFDSPGTFYYYCTLHHGMQGTLTIAP